MTAQIAIMNKSAIAMASDSAVSMQATSEHTSKIYNTVNKLFALSRHVPVGIMVYGNSEFLQTPWETIIKLYRQRLGDQTFPTLHDYARNFIEFLFLSNDLFPSEIRDRSLYFITGNALSAVLNDINGTVYSRFEKQKQVSESVVKEITADILSAHLHSIYSLPLLPHVQSGTPGEILKNHRSRFEKQIDEIFQKLPLTALQRMKLLWICSHIPCRDYFDEHKSGVVISGFGDDDIFPNLYSFTVQGSFRELIKYRTDKSGNTSQSVAAAIFPFAQSDMVGEFMEGCHPGQISFILQYLGRILKDLPGYILDSAGIDDPDKRESYDAVFSEFTKDIIESFREDLRSYQKTTHIDPVIKTVGMLPVDELAAMAGALVNLTRFRQKMSLEAETVGGPIDVAIITKGDGFVWVNRKQYFSGDLNPHVF